MKCILLEDTGRNITDKTEHGESTQSVYRRVDTGEELFLSDAPVGAMFFAPWLDKLYKPQLEHVLVARCPGGDWWIIDSEASNCTMKHKTNPDGSFIGPMRQDHHCWIIHGVPPNITVDKNGITCQAGAGSIQTSNWHGFLRNGEFVNV